MAYLLFLFQVMLSIFSSTMPIFLITLLGAIIKRKWLTSDEFWRNLEKLSYFLLFPIVLFNYISVADLSSSSMISLVIALIISSCIIGGALIFHQQKTESDRKRFTSTFQGSVRYNSYIFFALSGGLFGAEGLEIVAVISSYMIIFTNVITVMVFAKYTSDSNESDSKITSYLMLFKLLANNPLIIASLAGFLFNYSNMNMNQGLQKTLTSLSDAALAIGMLNVGAGLKLVLCPVYLRQIIFTSLIKLIAFPVVTWIVLWLMGIGGLAKSIGILYSSLPCASTAYVLSRQLNGDPDSMASIITFTTIFSVFSLSMMMYIFN